MDLYLIRHAHAGSRSADPHDKYRPLSDKGWERANALASIFDTVKIGRVLSSTATRCVQTVEPLAKSKKLEVIEHSILWEGSDISDVLDLLDSVADKPTVLCSHGDIIPGVIEALADDGVAVKGRGCEKGSIWVVTYSGKGVKKARYVSRKASALP